MAIAPQSKPTNISPLSSKCKQTKALEIKKIILKKTSTYPKQRVKTVSFDLPCNVIVSYVPKAAASAQTSDSQAKSAVIARATEVQASLPSELPSFVKPMHPSHVTGGFWLHDETVVLVDEDDQEFRTKYLVDKNGLSGGWRGFSIAHKLLVGDALVFQLIEYWKFKVYILRLNGLNEIDGALGLLNLVPCGMNSQIKKDSRIVHKAEDMDVYLHQDNVNEKDLVVFDQSGNEVDSGVSEGLRFSQSVLEFKDIKGVEDFSIVVDGLVIDSEIPEHFQIKYYDLCRSQKMYLHENLLKGLNLKLAVGVILETVTIADAIRACKVTTTRDDFETWDKTLKAFEEVGMKVAFLRDRIGKLVGLLFESNELLEAKRNKQAKAEEEMRVIDKQLSRVRDLIKNLYFEIETLKLKGQKLEPVFHKEVNAPW